MRALILLATLATLALVASPALAGDPPPDDTEDVYRLDFWGTVSDANPNFADFGVSVGFDVHGYATFRPDLVFEAGDPDEPLIARPALEFGRATVGDDYSAEASTLSVVQQCCGQVDVASDFFALRFGNVRDFPNVAGPATGRFEIVLYARSGESLFDDPTAFPSVLPDFDAVDLDRSLGALSGRTRLPFDPGGLRGFEFSIEKLSLSRVPAAGGSGGKPPPVPEPGTAILLGLGLAGLAARRHASI